MRVGLVTMFRDEAQYLKEWIEFHLLVGIDKFYLVNNNSIDNYLEILKPYMDQGTVELIENAVETKFNPIGRENEEIIVYHWIKKLNEIIFSSPEDWMIHVSTDEFLFPTEHSNIKDVLEGYGSQIGEISVNWTLFGNNQIEVKNGELLIEKLTKSCHSNHPDNYHVKPIVRPSAIEYLPSVHFSRLKPNFIKVDALGNSNNFKTEYEVAERVLAPLHINHYRFRDLAWTNSKLEMYAHWGRSDLDGNIYNDLENVNAIHRFVEPLKNKILK